MDVLEGSQTIPLEGTEEEARNATRSNAVNVIAEILAAFPTEMIHSATLAAVVAPRLTLFATHISAANVNEVTHADSLTLLETFLTPTLEQAAQWGNATHFKEVNAIVETAANSLMSSGVPRAAALAINCRAIGVCNFIRNLWTRSAIVAAGTFDEWQCTAAFEFTLI